MLKVRYRGKRNPLAVTLVLLLAIAHTGCGDNLDTVVLEIGGNSIFCEIARTMEEQAKGLMLRKSLPEDHGMLFIYESDRRLSYWMKDTRIPLSIAYISAEGIIKEIYDLKPFSQKEVLSKQSVRYALEVNQGYFESVGIGVGDEVIFPLDFMTGR